MTTKARGANALGHSVANRERARTRLAQVDHVAGEAVEGLLHGLGQRRVRVHVARRLEGGEVPLLRERELGKQLGHVGADEVAAEQLEVLAVGDELDEADRLAQAVRLAVRRERELRDLDVVAGVARLLLGEAERGDLRRAERGARHHAVVAERHGLGLADRLGRDDALRLGDVRELQLRGDIADRVDVRDRGVHEVVDLDRAAIGELHAGVLEPEALDVRREADRHHDLVGVDRRLGAVLRRVGHGDAVAVVDDGLDLGRGEDVDAVLLVLAGDLLRDVRVLLRQRAVEELDDRDLDAVVDAGRRRTPCRSRRRRR